MNITAKLVVTMVSVTGLAVLSAGSIATHLAATSLEHASYARLASLRNSKKRAIESYVGDLRRQTLLISNSPVTERAVVELAAALGGPHVERMELIGSTDAPGFAPATSAPAGLLAVHTSSLPEFLRSPATEFVSDTPLVDTDASAVPTASAAALACLGDPADAYEHLRAQHHLELRRFLDYFDLRNVVLLEPDQGTIVYSISDSTPLGASMSQDDLRETALADVFRRACAASDDTFVAMSDLVRRPGTPDCGHHETLQDEGGASLIFGSPIYSDGRLIGVAAIELDAARIDRVMSGGNAWRADGLGQTGETFLVGADLTLRTASRFPRLAQGSIASTCPADGDGDGAAEVLVRRIDTEATRGALQGVKSTRTLKDDRGVRVVSSYASVDLPDVSWGVVTQIDADEALSPVRTLRQRIGALAGAMTIGVTGLAGLFAATITRPVRRLAHEASRVGSDQVQHLDVRSNDEIGELAGAFNAMVTRLGQTTVSKVEFEDVLSSKQFVEQEQIRFRDDLAAARLIQQNLLPGATPARRGYDLSAWSESAHETGGDHHDWLDLDDDGVFLVVADATGHGVGSALLVADCRAYVRCALRRDSSVGTIAAEVNDLLAGDTPSGWFITATMASLDPALNVLRIFSAGHPPTLVYRAATDAVEVIDSDTIPLGLVRGEVNGEGQSIDLAPGDVVVVLTDGFYEWGNRDGEMYGLERLTTSLARHHRESAAQIITRMRQDLLAFVGATSQPDDMTIAVIRRNDDGDAAPTMA